MQVLVYFAVAKKGDAPVDGKTDGESRDAKGELKTHVIHPQKGSCMEMLM